MKTCTLGYLSEKVDRDTRTLWRYWQKEEMPRQILDEIAKELDVSFYYLTGSEHAFYKILLEDDDFKESLEKQLTPENYPYFRNYEHTASFENYDEYIELLLSRHQVSRTMYAEMSVRDRLHMLKDIEDAITNVLSSYYKEDALGFSSNEEFAFGLYSTINNYYIAAFEQFNIDFTGYGETDEAELDRKYEAFRKASDEGKFDF